MSYLFQGPGLLDDSGVQRFDYSRDVYSDVDEHVLERWESSAGPAAALPDGVVCASRSRLARSPTRLLPRDEILQRREISYSSAAGLG